MQKEQEVKQRCKSTWSQPPNFMSVIITQVPGKKI
jgi:hypothetical protein